MTDKDQEFEADVCLILEGSYPYVSGGVSAWTDTMMREQKDLTFSVVSILPNASKVASKFTPPDNMVALHHLYLHQDIEHRFHRANEIPCMSELVDSLSALTQKGDLKEFKNLVRLINQPENNITIDTLLNSPDAWDIVREMYHKSMPHGSFLHYFWAWRALFGGLFATLKFPLPKARIYHTISTGYAGLLSARAALETGRPALLTEHGIYTNERRIEVLMADWIADTLEKGFSITDERYDLRDMWTNTFESYARICYKTSNKILTLYEENQTIQDALGAERRKQRLIPNGVDIARFADLAKVAKDGPPTISLIGRVVPIKDIKTFITAVDILRDKLPDIRALIIGPTDEDPGYYKECMDLVKKLKLKKNVTFTGMADINEYIPQIHVNVLTSLSEAQPLVMLETGAAGIPNITTNVGACSEILLGRPEEEPGFGTGGVVTDLVAPEQTANAIEALLTNPELRTRYGNALKKRVERYYNTDFVMKAYSGLYHRYKKSLSGDRLFEVT